MSMNLKVTEAAHKCGEAYASGNTSQYRAAMDNYYKVLEEEVTAQGENAWGWLGWEDPVDTLTEMVYNEEDKAQVQEVLSDYIRFHKVISKALGRETVDPEVVEEAQAYLQ